MQAQIKLARISGIEIGLHYSWFIIAILITLSLAAHFRATNPHWGDAVVWTSAIATGLLFFAAIVLHELSHSVVAKARGVPVRSITLFALGGVAQMEKGAADPRTEFLVGIAGPVASVVIGSVCLGLAHAAGWTGVAPQRPVPAVLAWLGFINIMLALFNMVPGFPLDGGRVLRALVWWKTGDRDRSTRTAARVGQAIGLGFILLGLLRFSVAPGSAACGFRLSGGFCSMRPGPAMRRRRSASASGTCVSAT